MEPQIIKPTASTGAPEQSPAPVPLQDTTSTGLSEPQPEQAQANYNDPTAENTVPEPSQPNNMPAFMQPTPPVVSSPEAGKTGILKKLLGHKSNKLVAVIALPALLIAGSCGAYFGYVLPSKPSHIWQSALVNTGKGYDKISTYLTSKKSGTGIKLEGSFKLSGALVADGTFSGSGDNSNGDFKATLSASGLKTQAEVKTIKSGSSTTPDIYFKVDGLQGLGTLLGGTDSQDTNPLNGLNGKWYLIDHSFFDQFARGANSSLQFTSEDLGSVLNAVGAAGKQNIFTSDPSKMAFTVKQDIGKEKQDGRSVYHYKASINKQNLKNYVSTLCTNLKNSKLNKLFSGSADSTENALGCKTAAGSIDKFNSDSSSDVWVDTHTKLVHKIRFSEKNGNYFDIGQDYQGGDSFPFTLDFSSKDGSDTSTGSLKLTLNTKSNTVQLNGSFNSGSGNDAEQGSLSLTISPNNSAVKIDKPANAKSIIELLNDLGFGDVSGGDYFGSGSTKAQDTQRKTDINAIQGQIEAYFAQNSVYPSLAQMNSASWRSSNLRGLDSEALKDPQGTDTTLLSTPKAHAYAYQVVPAGCNNKGTDCTAYTLTATLDTGGTYAKKSLN
jgi:hypothetical protein